MDLPITGTLINPADDKQYRIDGYLHVVVPTHGGFGEWSISGHVEGAAMFLIHADVLRLETDDGMSGDVFVTHVQPSFHGPVQIDLQGTGPLSLPTRT